MYNHVMQYLPRIAMYSHVLSCIAMYYHVLHVLRGIACIDMYCYVLPFITLYCYVLPCVAMYWACIYVLSWNKVSELKSLFFSGTQFRGRPRKGSLWIKRYFPEERNVLQGCKRILVDKDIQVPFVTEENTLVKSQLRTYCPRRAGISPTRRNSEEALY